MNKYFENMVNSSDLISQILKFDNKKNIIIYGASEAGKYIKCLLEENKINVKMFIDKNYQSIDSESFDVPILSPDVIKNHDKDNYIIIATRYYASIENFLNDNGYKEFEDYIYILHKPTIIENCENYSDNYGNSIIGKLCNSKVKFVGYNCKLIIEENVHLKNNYFNFKGIDSNIIIRNNCTINKSNIIILSNSKFEIQNNSTIKKESKFVLLENSTVDIGENCLIKKENKFKIMQNVSFSINNNTEIGRESEFTIYEYSKFNIGSNCIINKRNKFIFGEKSIFFLGDYSEVGDENKFDGKAFTIMKLGKHCVILDYNNFKVSNLEYYNKVKDIEIHRTILDIGDYIYVETSNMIDSYNKLEIGNNVSIYKYCIITSPFFGSIKIGNDCMVAGHTCLFSSDAHAIIDLENRKQINTSNKYIEIGNHVWIGTKCCIMYNTTIKDGSIVGMNSFVKNSTFPENCIAAGFPAKIIKENVSWDRAADLKNFILYDVKKYSKYKGFLD